jgi:hypothetical protein
MVLIVARMKLYGTSRKDTLGCEYGCCGYPLARGLKHTGKGKAHRKAAKKRARREGKVREVSVPPSTL